MWVLNGIKMHGLYVILIDFPAAGLSSDMIRDFEKLVKWERNPLFYAMPDQFCDNYLVPLCLKWGAEPKRVKCEMYALTVKNVESGQNGKSVKLRMYEMFFCIVTQILQGNIL